MSQKQIFISVKSGFQQFYIPRWVFTNLKPLRLEPAVQCDLMHPLTLEFGRVMCIDGMHIGHQNNV